MYQSATFNSAVPTTTGLLAETIRNPNLANEEIQQQLETAEYEIQEIWAKPELIIGELVHVAAYKNNTLGHPLLCPKERLPFITKDVLEKYRQLFYRPERMVVAFAGVQHEEAVRLAERYFGDMEQVRTDQNPQLSNNSLDALGPLSSTSSIPSSASDEVSDASFPSSASSSSSSSPASSVTSMPSATPTMYHVPGSPSNSTTSNILSKIPLIKNLTTSASNRATVSPLNPDLLQPPSLDLNTPSHYTGGFLSLPPSPFPTNQLTIPLTHVHIAFESPSISSPDIYALATLQTLLGGGGSFSAGGPGKGMYSRLYRNVLNHNSWIESCVAFNNSFTDSGLFGIAATCDPDRVGDMVDVICRELHALTLDTSYYPSLQLTEVNRAKNQLRSSLLMNLESRLVELEDLGRQVQVHGRKVPAMEMCRRIDALTVDDLRRVAREVFGGQVQNPGMGSGAATVVVQEAAPDPSLSSSSSLSSSRKSSSRQKSIQWEEIQDRISSWDLGRRQGKETSSG